MKRHFFDTFDDILLSDRVKYHSAQFQSAINDLHKHDIATPLIIIKGIGTLENIFIIIDGNHRVIVSALEKISIHAYELESEKDIESILSLESLGKIAPFPHRGFLLGKITFRELRLDAIRAVAKQGGIGVPEVIRFIRRQDTLNSEIKQDQDHLNAIKYRLIRQPSLKLYKREKNEQPLPTYTVNQDISRDSVIGIAPVELKNWIEIVCEQFATHFNNREFPCSHKAFALICNLPENRGATVSSSLVREGLLEKVRVGSIESGEFYANGKPITNRVTYWRITKTGLLKGQSGRTKP